MAMAVRMARLAVMGVLAAALVGVPAISRAQSLETPTFRTAVDLVPISAIVRDARGRPVRDLDRHDFQVLEQGRPRPIVDFRVSDQGPISLAILMDVSGSMHVAGSSRQAAGPSSIF